MAKNVLINHNDVKSKGEWKGWITVLHLLAKKAKSKRRPIFLSSREGREEVLQSKQT